MPSKSRRDSLMLRYELFIAAATLAAHATTPTGFRQREVKFLTELFSNWLDVTLNASVLALQNTQVLRYLERLVEEGLAAKRSRARQPVYLLRPEGILELLRRLSLTENWPHHGHFFFVYFFLLAYRSQLATLATTPAPLAPKMAAELYRLIDASAIRDRYLKASQQKLKEIKERIESAHSSAAEVEQRMRQGATSDEVIAYVEKVHPYQLNNQKPLSELLGVLAPQRAAWELTEGARLRADLMWAPLESLLERFIGELKNLPGTSPGR